MADSWQIQIFYLACIGPIRFGGALTCRYSSHVCALAIPGERRLAILIQFGEFHKEVHPSASSTQPRSQKVVTETKLPTGGLHLSQFSSSFMLKNEACVIAVANEYGSPAVNAA